MPDSLHPYRDRAFTLDDLVDAAEALLRTAHATADDDRVSAFPDRRTIRYYQTLGVLDRPLHYEGRQAIYGYRHLLQAVATKLLQAAGHSLSQVQTALAGVDTARLEASVAPALGAPSPAPALPPPAQVPARAPRAWRAVELAPGVVVSLDPELVADPEALLARLTQALSP